MAEDILPVERRRAGADCLAALRRIGLDPEALFWARPVDRSDWTLMLITGLHEVAGPLDLSKLLFDAHNAKLLPEDVDPFDFEVWSPEQALAAFGAARDDAGEPIREPVGAPPPQVYRTEDFVIPSGGIYAWRPERGMAAPEREQIWHRLARRVLSRAA